MWQGLSCRQGLRLLFMFPPQPDSQSLFQQVPMISGVITGVKFGAAKRGFWRWEIARSSWGTVRGQGRMEPGEC